MSTKQPGQGVNRDRVTADLRRVLGEEPKLSAEERERLWAKIRERLNRGV